MRQPRRQFGHRHRFGHGEQDRLDHPLLLAHRRGVEQAVARRVPAPSAIPPPQLDRGKGLALAQGHLPALGQFQHRREMRGKRPTAAPSACRPSPRAGSWSASPSRRHSRSARASGPAPVPSCRPARGPARRGGTRPWCGSAHRRASGPEASRYSCTSRWWVMSSGRPRAKKSRPSWSRAISRAAASRIACQPFQLEGQMRRQVLGTRPLFPRFGRQQQARLQEGKPGRHHQVIRRKLDPQAARLFDKAQILLGQLQDRDLAQVHLLRAATASAEGPAAPRTRRHRRSAPRPPAGPRSRDAFGLVPVILSHAPDSASAAVQRPSDPPAAAPQAPPRPAPARPPSSRPPPPQPPAISAMSPLQCSAMSTPPPSSARVRSASVPCQRLHVQIVATSAGR